MFLKKQLFILVSFVIMLNYYQLEATRTVYFANNTQEPKLNDSNLDFTLVTADGKTKFNLGTFKSSLDLDQYEISKESPVKLIVKGIRLPFTVTNKPSVTSEILIQNTTYSITTAFGELAGSVILYITPENK
jgi:hypothetical protein